MLIFYTPAIFLSSFIFSNFLEIKNIILAIYVRGPSYGSRGKVMLAFEDNGSSKIGVRFDKSIPDGNDLGGLCEDDRGFFCSGNSLCLIEILLPYLHFSIFRAIILAHIIH